MRALRLECRRRQFHLLLGYIAGIVTVLVLVR